MSCVWPHARHTPERWRRAALRGHIPNLVRRRVYDRWVSFCRQPRGTGESARPRARRTVFRLRARFGLSERSVSQSGGAIAMYNFGSQNVRHCPTRLLRRPTPSHYAPSSQSVAVGYVTVSNSTFRNNLADLYGGAVAMLIGVYTSSASVFSGNAATSVRCVSWLMWLRGSPFFNFRGGHKSFWVPSSVARCQPPIRRSWWCVSSIALFFKKN